MRDRRFILFGDTLRPRVSEVIAFFVRRWIGIEPRLTARDYGENDV